jgi:hypothetical protein
MKRVGVIFAGLAAVAVMAGAGAANAQQARVRPQPSANPAPDAYTVSNPQTAQQPNQISPQTRRSTLRWDALRGRWGLQLDMDQSAQRDLQWRDVQAGAYYSVTRQLRVGGSVGVSDPDALTRRPTTPPAAPRVRLETAFRF